MSDRLHQPLVRQLLVSICIALCTCAVLAAQPSKSASKEVWITIGEDLFRDVQKTPGIIPGAFALKAEAALDGVVITRMPEASLPAVSELAHETYKRCGGFIVHDSLDEARVAMKVARTNSYKTLPSDFLINQQAVVNPMLPQMAASNILATITHLSTNYVNRYYQYASGQQSALWIRDQWVNLAGSRSDVTVTTYTHSFTQPSVIMTIDGADPGLQSEIVVLGGHLDSIKSGGMTTSTIAPGADDNASGIATITEVIRVLMANNFVPDRTIKFMGYAGEENGLLGSGDIAADAQANNDDVVAVMQLDMTDYNGSVEDFTMITDNTNSDLTAFVESLIDEYMPGSLRTTGACGYACSDHASWHQRGFPAVFPFESQFGQYNPNIHTSNDDLATLGNQADHALKFAKLALSFIAETGLADCTPAPAADAGPDQNITEGNSIQIGTPAQAGNTYSWSPGGATTAQITVSPTSTTVYTVTATTSCGSSQDSVTVNVTPAGQNGPQNAVYDAGLGAPQCATVGSSCDSQGLLDGRGTVGPEPNAPNTLDSCTDGNSGTYHSDESADRIVVSTLDGLDFSEGATVNVDVTVYAYSTGSSDTLDLWYAADANNPSWQLIGSYTSAGGIQTINAQYTLPAGALQAVRANYRYQGSQSTCSTGSYDDTDDLVFAVGGGAPQCTVNADCDDGAWCNGAEVCNAGTCEAGTAPSCDDGVSCTDDSCNEGTDSCDNVTNDGNCDNGLFCDGAETCDAVNGCQAGTAPNCDDGVSCTDDSCNEGTDSCDNVTNDSNCDDGLFCNGSETCDAVNGCQVASDPCAPFGCDEAGDVCLECNVNADCDDGLFCNGVETCNAGTCQAGTAPCTGGQTCDEVGDVCNTSAPTEVTFISIGAEDGWTRESNETSNVGGSSNSTGSGSRPIRPGDANADRQYKSILSFDTSSIPPGATIQSATLRLRRGTVRGSDPFTSGFGACLVDVQTGGFSGSTALQNSDFEASATAVGAASLTAPASNGDWSEGVLNAAGLAAINLSGTTQFRVYFTLDDNDDGGEDVMGYYSGDNGTAANRPQLVVTYVE